MLAVMTILAAVALVGGTYLQFRYFRSFSAASVLFDLACKLIGL